MAKGEVQRGRFVAEDEEPRLLDGSVIEPEVSDEEAAYLNFRDSLKAGEEMPTLRVSKVPKSGIGNPMHAKLIYCFACPVDQYSFEELCEYVRECYGGGMYRLMATQKGKRGTLFNQLLNIAEVAQIRRPLGGEGPGSPGGANPSAIMETVGTLINQSQERMEALIARLTPAPAAAPVDQFEHLTKLVGLLSTLGFGKPVAPPQTDLLTELTKLAQLKGVLGGILGGNDDGGGGGAAETNFYDTINQTLKTVAPALAAVIPRVVGGTPALPAPNPPAAATGPIPETGGPAATPSVADVNLKRQVDMLVMYAKAGQTPEAVADMVLDVTPEERYPELHTYISRPTLVNEMVAMNPEVANHRAFFDKLRAVILEDLTPEPAANAATPGPTT